MVKREVVAARLEKLRFFRESEQVELRGASARARTVLGWECRRDFDAMVAEMTDHDLALLQQGSGG